MNNNNNNNNSRKQEFKMPIVIDTNTHSEGPGFWGIFDSHIEDRSQIARDSRLDELPPRYLLEFLDIQKETAIPICYSWFGSDNLNELILHARELGLIGIRGIV